MIDHGMITISRAAIEKWNRAADTVDFITSDEVSLMGFAIGMQVKFTFEVREGNFVIVAIERVEITKAEKPAVIDHSNH